MTDRKQEAIEIQKLLLEAARKDREIAEENPETSGFFNSMSELMDTAARAMNSVIPQKMEIEGGGQSWWYVCPECHGAIDRSDHFCRHCGQAVEE